MEYAILLTVYTFLLYWAVGSFCVLSAAIQNQLISLYYPDIDLDFGCSQYQGLDPLAVEAVKIDAWFFETHL